MEKGKEYGFIFLFFFFFKASMHACAGFRPQLLHWHPLLRRAFGLLGCRKVFFSVSPQETREREIEVRGGPKGIEVEVNIKHFTFSGHGHEGEKKRR